MRRSGAGLGRHSMTARHRRDANARGDEPLSRLTSRHCDGQLTVDDRDHLAALLRSDPQSRHFFLAYLDQHAQLLWRYREAAGPLPADPPGLDESASPPEPMGLPAAGRRPFLGFLADSAFGQFIARGTLLFWLVAIVTNVLLVFGMSLALSPNLRRAWQEIFRPRRRAGRRASREPSLRRSLPQRIVIGTRPPRRPPAVRR